jgi:hypothetical protein
VDAPRMPLDWPASTGARPPDVGYGGDQPEEMAMNGGAR